MLHAFSQARGAGQIRKVLMCGIQKSRVVKGHVQQNLRTDLTECPLQGDVEGRMECWGEARERRPGDNGSKKMTSVVGAIMWNVVFMEPYCLQYCKLQ